MTRASKILEMMDNETPGTVVSVSEEQYEKAFKSVKAKYKVIEWNGNIGISSSEKEDKDNLDKILKEAGIEGYQISE